MHREKAGLSARVANRTHVIARRFDLIKVMLEKGGIVSTNGHLIKTPIHSICVHGDNPNSVKSAKLIHEYLAKHYQLVSLVDLFT